MWRILGDITNDLDLEVKGQIVFFRVNAGVNASPPNLFDITSSNFARA